MSNVNDCSRCGGPLVCHCGDYVEDHRFSEHVAVPMDCPCDADREAGKREWICACETQNSAGDEFCRACVAWAPWNR